MQQCCDDEGLDAMEHARQNRGGNNVAFVIWEENYFKCPEGLQVTGNKVKYCHVTDNVTM
jgi:hypothetical protein